MSSLEGTDGRCGLIHPSATSDQQVRCKYAFGHDGPHSYSGTESKSPIGGVFVHPVDSDTQRSSQKK